MTTNLYSFYKSIEPKIKDGQNEFIVQWETGLGQIMLGKFDAAKGQFFRMDGCNVGVISRPDANIKLARQSLIDIFVNTGKWIFELVSIK